MTVFAKEEKWPVFQNQVRYSASYAKSAREGTSIRRTSYSRWEVIQNFDAVRDEFFRSIGLTPPK